MPEDNNNNELTDKTQAELLSIVAKKDRQINALSVRLNWFEEQLRLLKSKRYAKSSEQRHALQMELFDENEDELQAEPKPEANKETITYTRTKAKRSPKNLDTSALPREQRIIDLDECDKQCGCDHALEQFGEQTKEELVFVPATLKVIEHVRLKYTCRHCETVTMPKAVELPLSKSKASASLITDIIINKYRFHLPFYRQSKLFASYNIKLADNTLAHWVMQAAEVLQPLGDALWAELAKVNVLQADETPVKVLKPEKKAYMWLYHCYLPEHRFVIFDFNLSRSASVVDERLQSFSGLLQTDGYAGYNGQRRRRDIITLGCWDHARRKFADVVKAAGKNKSGKAGQMLDKIAKLYDIEAHIKELPPDEKQQIRQEKAKPILELIHSFVQKIHAPPKSLLGTAVTYCNNQWPELIRYVDHGQAQISNCWIENQVRPFALGKRNWLFVGNERFAKKAALLYSLIQSCELNDIAPRDYLKFVLTQVHAMRRGDVQPGMLLPHTIDTALLEG